MTWAIVKDDVSAEEPIVVDILAVENDISTPFTKCHLDMLSQVHRVKIIMPRIADIDMHTNHAWKKHQ